ncbi:MAG: chemotaxis protein, partial [Aeromonadaceae bacterium]|nr:chemotaxis protein [Aeromonadaceae bacterium]
ADAEAASKALDEITRAVSLISDMSTQIATAAEEQSKVTDEITRNIHEIKDLADTLTQDASDSAALARSQQEQANTLNQQVAKFRL